MGNIKQREGGEIQINEIEIYLIFSSDKKATREERKGA